MASPSLQCSLQAFPYANLTGDPCDPGAEQRCNAVQYPAGVSNESYKKTLDAIQLVLDGVGLIPGFGEAADGVNALISGMRGDYIGAALSVVCMVPVAGYVGNALKAGRHLPAGGMVRIVKELGERTLRTVADSMGALVDFMSALPGKLRSIFQRLKSWPASLSDDTYRALTRAIDPVFKAIDEAFADVMKIVDEAFNGPPTALAMAGGRPPASVLQMKHTPPRRRPSGGGGGGRGGKIVFRQGDHLVNSGLTKVLDALVLPNGQGGAILSEARKLLDHPNFKTVVQGVAKAGPDANSTAFGWAAERTRTAAQLYREAKTPGQRMARSLSLRAELRDMLKAAIDVETAANPQIKREVVSQVEEQLTKVWSLIDGAIARSAVRLSN